MTFEPGKSGSRTALPALSQRPYALIFALLTAFVTNVVLCWLCWNFGIGADYEVFWRSVRNPAPYAFNLLPFGNPPTTLVLLQPLKLVPFWSGLVVWDAASFALFFFLGSRLYGRKAAMLAAVSPPVVMTLIAGQISLVVGALVVAAFLSEPMVCGILLAVAVCAKPQMVFLAPLLFLFAREVRPLAAFCGTVALFAIASTLAWGPSIWSDWIQGMQNLLYVAKHRGALDLTISPMSRSPWLGLISLPLSVGGLYLCRNSSNARKAAAVVAASLFAAPYALAYDLAPLALFAAVPILESSDWRSFCAALTYSGALGSISIPCLWPSLRREDQSVSVEPLIAGAQSRRTWMVPTRSA